MHLQLLELLQNSSFVKKLGETGDNCNTGTL